MRKTAVKDLKIGDMVVGHNDLCTKYSIIAGEITKITRSKTGMVVYHIQGIDLQPRDKSIDFSGELSEDEVDVIDQPTCKIIFGLYERANKEIIAGSSGYSVRYHETVGKSNELRHRARAELEEKYAVAEAQ